MAIVTDLRAEIARQAAEQVRQQLLSAGHSAGQVGSVEDIERLLRQRYYRGLGDPRNLGAIPSVSSRVAQPARAGGGDECAPEVVFSTYGVGYWCDVLGQLWRRGYTGTPAAPTWIGDPELIVTLPNGAAHKPALVRHPTGIGALVIVSTGGNRCGLGGPGGIYATWDGVGTYPRDLAQYCVQAVTHEVANPYYGASDPTRAWRTTTRNVPVWTGEGAQHGWLIEWPDTLVEYASNVGSVETPGGNVIEGLSLYVSGSRLYAWSQRNILVSGSWEVGYWVHALDADTGMAADPATETAGAWDLDGDGTSGPTVIIGSDPPAHVTSLGDAAGLYRVILA